MSPDPEGGRHKIRNRGVQKRDNHPTQGYKRIRNYIYPNNPQNKYRIQTVSKNILPSANIYPQHSFNCVLSIFVFVFSFPIFFLFLFCFFFFHFQLFCPFLTILFILALYLILMDLFLCFDIFTQFCYLAKCFDNTC